MMDFAELEREMDSERILGQLRAARAAGRWSAAATPYGYRKNEDSELVVDEPKAEAIRFIFERYPVIKSAKQVAKELNDRFGPKEPGTPGSMRRSPPACSNGWPGQGRERVFRDGASSPS
jgi:hypothetical protein